MEFHGIPIKSLWTLVAWIPGFMLRRFFSKEKLAALIYVDLRPRHDPATINLGETTSLEMWLDVINLSPFQVELDRASFRFWYGGSTISTAILKRQIIAPGETVLLQLSNSIPEGMAVQIAKTHLQNDAKLDGFIEFNCKVHHFCKIVGHLSGIKPRILNANFRTARDQV